MFCKECGEQLIEGARFCKSCGKTQPIISTYSESHQRDENYINEEFAPDEKVDIVEQIKLIKKHKIFHNDNETLIDTLGSGLISTIVVQGNFGKSVMFCSNKRVYQKGKIIVRSNLGKLDYYNGDSSVDLRDITGLRFIIMGQISRFGYFLFFILFGIMGLLNKNEFGFNIIIVEMFSWFFIFLGIMSLFIYQIKKPKYFIIEYAGGEMITNCNWYARKSIRRFMKNISKQKDKLFE